MRSVTFSQSAAGGQQFVPDADLLLVAVSNGSGTIALSEDPNVTAANLGTPSTSSTIYSVTWFQSAAGVISGLTIPIEKGKTYFYWAKSAGSAQFLFNEV